MHDAVTAALAHVPLAVRIRIRCARCRPAAGPCRAPSAGTSTKRSPELTVTVAPDADGRIEVTGKVPVTGSYTVLTFENQPDVRTS